MIFWLQIRWIMKVSIWNFQNQKFCITWNLNFSNIVSEILSIIVFQLTLSNSLRDIYSKSGNYSLNTNYIFFSIKLKRSSVLIQVHFKISKVHLRDKDYEYLSSIKAFECEYWRLLYDSVGTYLSLVRYSEIDSLFLVSYRWHWLDKETSTHYMLSPLPTKK